MANNQASSALDVGQVSRGNIGDNEKKFVLECHNLSMGKRWKEVLALAKQRVIDAGLPQRVVQIYMEAPQQRITNRMKNILRKALASSTPSTSPTSTSSSKPVHHDALPEVKEQQMRYAVKGTPAQRQMQSKLKAEFVFSSSDSEIDGEKAELSKKKRKTDREIAREAQEAHKEMCSKAMETMDRVNNLLSNVEAQIKKGQ